MTLLVFLLLAVPAIFGMSVLNATKACQEKMLLFLIGTIGGLAFFVTASYLVSTALPLTAASLVIQLTLLAIAAAFLLHKSAWRHWKETPLHKDVLIVFLLTFALFAIIAPKLLIQQEDGLYTGIINAYGDVAWHVANITAFAEGQSVPPENPIYAGTRLTYPFLVNFFSAMLIVGGAALSASVTYPAVLLIPVLLTLFYYMVRAYSVNSSLAATVALLLFLFGGATFGWTRFGQDFQASGTSLAEFLLHLPNRDYSGVGTDINGFHFLNPTTTLLLPQRPFLFGISLAFAILLLLLPSLDSPRHGEVNDTKIKGRYMVAGILAGLLPLFHAHTVVALVPAIIALFIINPGLHWLAFIIPTAVIGIPEVLYYASGEQESGSFFRYGPGWMAGETNILWYWFKNTGLLIPIALAGLFLNAPKHVKALAIAGLLLLVTANIFLFAPWAWDNFKLIVFWFIFSLPLIGWIGSSAIKEKWIPLAPAAVVLFVALHTLSAGLDIWKITLPTAAIWTVWDNASISAAQNIQQATQPGEAILTAPIHNSAAVLAGRPIYLGYPAHVWSHGGLPWDREKAIESFYTAKTETLPDTMPTYILIGPVENAKYNPVIRPHWKLIFQEGDYALYRSRQ